MSIKVLVREYPHRSIALATPSHALVFQYSPSSNTDNSSVNGYPTGSSTSYASLADKYGTASRIMVEFSSLSAIDLQDYRPLTHSCKGTLGLVTLGRDVFICLVNGSSHVATVRPGERVERIHTVEFHCLNRSDYDRMLEREVNSHSTSHLDEDGFEYGQPLMEHPCLAIKKLLSGGTFYYSTDFDLTNRLQNRSIESHTFDIDNFDPSFLWNSYMIAPLLKFRSHLSNSERRALDESHLLTSSIRGFVETLTIPHSSSFSSKKLGAPASLTLISRLSCRRAGTRFNARGIDDEGNVANFVETEVVIWDPAGGAAMAGLGFSYCQVRGSVPVFWEQQTGLLPTQQKITLSRSPEATQPAFDKHFERLTLKYGVTHVVNLLSATKLGEVDLSERFRYHIRNSPLNHDPGYQTEKLSTGQGVRGTGGGGEGTLIRATEYDFHAETQGRYENAHSIRRLLKQSAEGFAYFAMEELDAQSASKRLSSETAVVLLQQEGVFRTNCLDCLDRTNLVQGILSQIAIESFLYHRQDDVAPDFWVRHSTLWADNGDALSKIYAGTGALKSSFTRHGKSSWGGLIADARKSATRMYINKFVDGGRQETIDVLLGRQLGMEPVQLYDPINDYAQAELLRSFVRAPEYTSIQKIHILVGTFNVNGRMNGLNDDMSSWLCPESMEQQPEVVVVGFQEIVELSPQQIMSTDPVRRQLWEKAVLGCLNMNAVQRGGDEYILLRSGQLVGAALMIFVRSSAICNIRNVEGSLKKTGMSGAAGNKGAVAIRLDYASTRLCFVTAHLAAGFANYEERNRDYRIIAHGLRFQRGRAIDDHDSVIWLGDFNYRIGLENEKVRKLIEMGDLQTLYDNDQLNLQMMAGLTFPYYSEAILTFNPTYKFDVGRDNYDTSEKTRIPAWCDRVLRKGANLKQLSYNSAPLRFSDHRPVYATFQCTVTYIDEAVKDKLSRQIYFKRRSEMGGANGKISMVAMVKKEEEEEEDLLLLGDEPGLVSGLPPPSSDTRKWWLDNGNLARSSVKPPGPDYIYSPKKPSNPFSASMEPDWVKVDLTGASTASSIANARNGYPAPPKGSVSPTPSVRPINARPTSPLTNSSQNLNNQIHRKRLPPPYDPSNLPALPTRANTSNSPGIGGTKSALSSTTTSSVKRKVLAPPPTSYPQSTENTTNASTQTLLRKPLPLPPPPLTISPAVSQIQPQLQQLSVIINSPIPPTPESVTLSSVKKPPVPRKPSVLTKPPPTTTRTPSPPLQSSRPTPPPASPQPNRLSKPPPLQPMNLTSSSSALPPTASKSAKPEPTPAPARLRKPSSTAKFPPTPNLYTTSQSAPQSPIIPIAPVPPPPPPPTRKSVVSGPPPAAKMSATEAGVPLPPPVRAMTLATDIVERNGAAVAVAVGDGWNEGVDSESQITDVRKGVARWESLG